MLCFVPLCFHNEPPDKNHQGKGMMITVKHYVKDGYINTDGIITEVDNTFKRLRIVRTYINYDDIDDITGEDIVEPDF